MSDYSKITNFLSKDSLSLNDPAKYVKGSEIDAEYNAIAVAIATKADTASPTLTTPTMSSPTITGTITAAIANFSGLVTAALGLTVSGAAFNSRGITDNATAKALTLSGSGANSVTIANSATNPTISTTGGVLHLSSNSGAVYAVGAASQSIVIQSNTTGTSVLTLGNATNAARGQVSADNAGELYLSSFATGGINFYTAGGTLLQAAIVNTASADRYITLTGSNGGNPTIGTSGGSLAISNQYSFFGTSVANYIQLQGNTTLNSVGVIASGSDSDIGLRVSSKGAYAITLNTNESVTQVAVTHTAAADRYITLTGSNGGNPTIGTSGGDLKLTANTNTINVLGALVSTLQVYANNQTATPAGGAVNTGVFLGSAGIGIFFGSGAPTVSAVKGSIYLRSNGSTTNDRMYINTDGNTTWTAVTTAA